MKIGVLGTGQLCLMMAQASKSLDVELIPVGEQENPLLNPLCKPHYLSFDDTEKLVSTLEQLDVITFETESVPDNVLQVILNDEALSKKCQPNLASLQVFKNRLSEKNYFTSLDLPTAKYTPLVEASDIELTANVLTFPVILKTCEGGYDGKGQARVYKAEDLEEAWASLGELPCIAEQFVSFEKEVSLVGARDLHGNIVFYPVIENYHRDGILRLSVVDQASEHQASAEKIMTSLLEGLNYVGCMALEFFVDDDSLVLNEVAPRVHNSGHWTMDACDDSQFLLHLKAISGEKLTTPSCQLPAAMFNCIGEMPSNLEVAERSSFKLYDYGKVPQPNRKLGHINFVSASFTEAFYSQLSEYKNSGDEAAFLVAISKV